MSKVLKFFKITLVMLSVLFVTITCVACVSIEEPVDEYKPTVSVFEQVDATNINVCVNKNNSASFTIPVVIDVDLSMFNTGTESTNNKLFVNSIIGENLDDLSIISIQRDCLEVNSKNSRYVCTFDFKVSTKSNWVTNQPLRQITQIEFKLLDSIINVPVKINIYEKIDNVDFVNQCAILNNIEYLTLVNDLSFQSAYKLALNWNIVGWGGISWEDENYATIVGFRFANSSLKLDSFNVIVANEEGYKIPEKIISFDLNDVNYDLTSKQCYWTGNFVNFEVSFANINEQCVSDCLIMQYTLNGSSDIYEVNLATIQLYDYESLINRMV